MQPNNQLDKKHVIQAGAILGTDSLTFFNLANPFMLTLRSAQFLLHSYIAYSVCFATSDNDNNEDENCSLLKKRFIVALHFILGSITLANLVMLCLVLEVDKIKDCHKPETEFQSFCLEIDLLSYIHFGMIAASGAVGLIQGIKQNLLSHTPDSPDVRNRPTP